MSASPDDVAFQVRKKIFPGAIDVHPTENAIIVHYTAQASIIGDNGQPVAGDKKMGQKIVRVKALNTNSNISSLAQEVIEKCKLIHSSRYAEVEQVLYYLQQRQSQSVEGDTTGYNASADSDRAWLRRQLEESRKMEESDRDGVDLVPVQDEPSSMANIEEYIEGLYEEIAEKVKSTRNILQLAKIPENMTLLIKNESLMSALSRVLREDGRKSMELVTNIIYIFFCFSNFSGFHAIITANKLGDMCLRIADQEQVRFDLWVQDLQKLEARVAQTPGDKSLVAQLDLEHRKTQSMLRKQDQLLFAEDLSIEVKMVKRGIVKYLINLLDRKTPELLILVITFLKKLSVFKENKDEILKVCVILRLVLNLSHDSTFRGLLIKEGFHRKLVNMLNRRNFLMVTLQLLYQLSLEDKHRASSVFTDCIPQVIRMILEYKGERVNVEIMALAINMATIQRNAQIISEDNGIKFLMKRAIKTRDPLLFKMLRNISQVQDESIKMKFLDYIDDMMHLLLKSAANPDIMIEILGILGNLTIAEFDFGKLVATYDLFYFFTSIITAAVSHLHTNKSGNERSSGRQGTLQAGPSASGSDLRTEGIAEDDDILLEVIILLGTMSLDENIAPMVASTNLLHLLIDVMIGKTIVSKEEDDEIILQVCYCIYQFLLHDSTKKILIGQTEVVGYLIDLLYDRNIEIRKMCDASLSIIGEIDEDWERKLKQQKFAWHNSEWISIMARVQESPSSVLEESAILYSKSQPIKGTLSRSDQHGYQRSLTPGVYDDSDDEEEGYRNGIGGSNALLDGPGLLTEPC
eukprot:jgi/Hompol1/5567/HPOL_000419-RA